MPSGEYRGPAPEAARDVCVRTAHKYHAIPTEVDGRRFASKREAARYQELCLLLRARQIADLECQPKFPLAVVKIYRNGWPMEVDIVGHYIGDFQYTDLRTGEIVVEDVKGVKTPVYQLKKRLMRAIQGIQIREV